MHRGRDVITIASALVPNGCDVIASLPRSRHLPPGAATRHLKLVSHFCTFAQAAGQFALLHFNSESLPAYQSTSSL